MSEIAHLWCVVCGDMTTKRQSLAYTTKDGKVGRACRKHPEVMRAMQERIEAEDTKRHEDLQRKIQAKTRQHRTWTIPNGPCCWHCHKEGITAQQHWLRMMIANEKCALQGTTFLNPQILKESYGGLKPVLVYVKVWDGHDLVKRTEMGMVFHQMSGGHMFVCGDCAAKFNILPEWEKALQPAEVTPEMLKAMMLISDSLTLTHVVKAVAKIEVSAEKGNAVAVLQESAQ